MASKHKDVVALLVMVLLISASNCSSYAPSQNRGPTDRPTVTPATSIYLPTISSAEPTSSQAYPTSVAFSTPGDNTAKAKLPTIEDNYLYTTPFYGIEFVPVEDLVVIRKMGIEVVLSAFPHDGTVQSWEAYLDQAYALGIKVIGRLWPEGWHWDGSEWQIDSQTRRFIQTLANHPATIAVYALEEPYWQGCWGCGYTTYQLQLLYISIKEIARVPIYSEVDSMRFWTKQGKNTAFADGICDYCASWFYPFLADGSFQREELIEHITADLAVIRSKAPASKFVWLMQSFAQDSTYRLPTAQEMHDLAAIVYSMQVDGALWYCWKFGSLYSDFLSEHPELYPEIRNIYQETVIPIQ